MVILWTAIKNNLYLKGEKMPKTTQQKQAFVLAFKLWLGKVDRIRNNPLSRQSLPIDRKTALDFYKQGLTPTEAAWNWEGEK